MHEQPQKKVYFAMKIKIETEDWTLETLNENFSKIQLDPSFQVPGVRWNDSQMSAYFANILKGFGKLSKITLADLERMRGSNDKESEHYEYFNSRIKEGWDFSSVDGNNRTNAIIKILGGEVPIPKGEYILPDGYCLTLKKKTLFTDFPSQDQLKIKSLSLEISKLVSGDKDSLREVFVNINKGSPLNEWEKNNAIDCVVSETLRKGREKFRSMLETIGGKKEEFFDRRKADGELFRIWFMERHNGEQSWSASSRIAEYDNDSELSPFITKANTVWSWIDELIKIGGDRILKANGTSVTAAALGDLAMLHRYISDENYKLNDLHGFVDWWCDRQNRRYKDTDTTWTFSSDVRNYADTCRAMSVDHFHVRKECLHTDFELTYRNETNVTKLDSKRNFKPSWRYTKWEEQNGECPVTSKKIPQTEINDGTIWQLDHITPYSKGGPTSVDNCQLICAEANREKSNK